ncbi:serine hydrolase domain-containing protein [Luteipulveratus halotolerans]|uniref:Penicillin-binding protein n=1 Tax=Luteipulveratus halotolerans TaxID=1631356 RepID=A0A0L6CMM0_9MICO|nr:serine hydrolase domain-containing protein [Luteipulveratus halotolerans]KNX38969.1 penicillin-binding protein [Luteipulveratus halotolerans]
MSDALQELLTRHVTAGTVVGAAGLFGTGADVEVVTAGSMSLDGPPMRDDAVLRIESMTKAVTAVAALRLVEGGALSLDQSVVAWLPELADRQVLRTPTAPLDDTAPARREITLHQLLTCTSGYGVAVEPSPLQDAMEANGTAAGPEPPSMGADEWLARLASLPLAFEPGEGWRYHHSFGLLGILIARVVGRPLHDHLTDDVLGPLGMADTGFWVPESAADRLPAAYRNTDRGLVEIEPAAGGFYAGPPPYDVSHAELVSTTRDYHRFLRVLVEDGQHDGRSFVSSEHVRLMTSDQVPTRCKTPDSFFPGFWDGMGWGYGVVVHTEGPHRGRFGWSGGLGTDFFVDPDGTIALLMPQVEMGPALFPVLEEFQALG